MKKIDSFRGDYYFLSNFYPAPVEYNGIKYLNSEAAFHAQKTLDFNEQKQFANLDPSKAKYMGRKITLRPDWEEVKVKIMLQIVRAKFNQNPDLAEKLALTMDAELEEGNDWGDKCWGTVNGEGNNYLGKILMKVRDELKF